MKDFELKPGKYINQKSFYGKATIIETDTGYKLLKSYETFVAVITPNNKIVRLWPGYSATTAKHVNAFLQLYGMPGINKKVWDSIPVETDSDYISVILFDEKVRTITSAVNINKLLNDIERVIKGGKQNEI